MIKITKLDRRYNGHQWFKYIVEIDIMLGQGRDERVQEFKNLRNWCWETAGPGCELGFVQLHVTELGLESLEKWAWDTEYNNQRLYLKDDELLTLLKLKWS
jgi:hypothetical protein